MRYRLFQLINRAGPGDKISRIYDLFIVAVALLSLVPLMFKEWNDILSLWDLATAYILLFDYIMRWITHDFKSGKKGWRAFLRYPFTPMAIIELLAILPSFNLVDPAFRFLRVLRIFKVLQYSKSLTLVMNVFKREKQTLLSVLVLAIGYVFISALVMFVYEPDTFDDYYEALYWATTALTTVGYGDVYPISPVGRFISMASSFVGIAIIALPSGIVTGSFLEEMRLSNENPEEYFRESEQVEDGIAHFTPLPAYPGFKRTLAFIVGGCALNIAIFEVTQVSNLPLWMATAGTALAAFMAGPFAGVIVALFNNMFLSIFHYGASDIIFLTTSIIVVLVWGSLLRPIAAGMLPTTTRKVAHILIAATCLLVVVPGLDTFFLYWLWGGTSVSDSETALREWVVLQVGASSDPTFAMQVLCTGITQILSRLFDTALSAATVFLGWFACRENPSAE